MTTDDHAAQIDRQGYAILRSVFSSDQISALNRDVERLERDLAIRPAGNIFEGSKTLRVYNLLARGKSFEAAVENEAILAVLERVLGKGFLVGTVSSIAIEPGEIAQPIHADDQLVPLPRPHLPLTSTVMVALTEFTEENGATRLVPGTQVHPAFPDPFAPHADAIQALMKPGDALVYNGSLWHGGGANRSNARRVGLAIGYCAGFLRQQENQQLGIPREIAKGFSPRLRKLVGYGLYRALYGHIDKCSPVDLLDECEPRIVVGVTK